MGQRIRKPKDMITMLKWLLEIRLLNTTTFHIHFIILREHPNPKGVLWVYFASAIHVLRESTNSIFNALSNANYT